MNRKLQQKRKWQDNRIYEQKVTAEGIMTGEQNT